MGNTKFVKMTDGISGELGNLVVDENYEPPAATVPIDTLVLSLAGGANDDDDDEDDDQIAV